MYSKGSELAGLALISIGIAAAVAWWAGMIFGGISLLFIGSATDDAAVSLTLRRGWGWVRYAWHRQLLRESGIAPPKLSSMGLPSGWVPCGCGGDEDCPLCEGSGFVPDPTVRSHPRSPHPQLKVTPDAESFWSNVASVRSRRAGSRNGESQGRS